MAIDKINATALLDGGVSTADIADDAITTAKIADANVTLAKLSATGTKDNTTFLRGDNSFQVVAVTPTAVSDQANTSTGYFDIPAGTTAQRPSGAEGNLRFNTTTGVVEFYSEDYSGWYPINSNPAEYTAQVLVVAGGGAGGYTDSGWVGGGGGAGGISYHSSYTVLDGTAFTVTVGAGASGPDNDTEMGTDNVADNGGDSQFSATDYTTLTAYGGGGGAGYVNAYVPGSAGGSGGGGEGQNGGQNASAATKGVGGTTLYGNTGAGGTGGTPYNGGGGGGAGGSGAILTGGAGTSDFSAWGAATSTGENVSGTYYYAGGGGGGSNGGTGGTGGNGGGGNGGSVGGTSGGNAIDGTGGGGGGRGQYNAGSGVGGDGGDGVVIIRYTDGNGQRGAGGTVTQTGGYYYHKFTSSGTWTA